MAEVPEGKLILFWIIGALALLLGSWIAGHVEKTLGVTDLSYALALLVALILFLFGGFLWIAVAIGVMHEEEQPLKK
jgi:hypothetical protein